MYDEQWAMFRAAEAARLSLSGDAPALELLDVALFDVLGTKPVRARPFERLRIAALPARAALEAWRRPLAGDQALASSCTATANIVFGVWSESHIKHLAPVAHALAASNQAAPIFLVFRDPRLATALERQSLGARWIGTAVSRRHRLDAVARFARRMPAALRVARELQRALGEQAGAEDYRRALLDAMLFGVAAVTPLELAARRALAELCPAGVVVANHEMPVGRMLGRLALERGTPLIQVQHGIVARHPKHAWPHPGTVCVWGSQTKLLLESLGWSSAQIRVCGAPGLDALGRLEKRQRARSQGKKLVLYTPVSGNSLTPAADVEAATSALYAALSRRQDIELIVKPHPVDRLHIPQRMLASFPALRASVVTDGDLHRLMLDADVVATMWSTTALEAVLLERPVVVIAAGADDPLPIAEYGAALKAGDVGAIGAALESLFDAQKAAALAAARARFVAAFASGNDGRAAERTAEVVLDVTRRGGPRRTSAEASHPEAAFEESRS